MSLTFQKAAIIEAANDALTNHVRADREYQRDVAAFKAAWTVDHDMLPRWKSLRDELSAFLKTRRQPTAADAKALQRAAETDYLSSFYASAPSVTEVNQAVKRPAAVLSPTTVDSYRGLIKMLGAAH